MIDLAALPLIYDVHLIIYEHGGINEAFLSHFIIDGVSETVDLWCKC